MDATERNRIAAPTSRVAAEWLQINAAKELELLLKAVVCHRSETVLIVDEERNCVYANPSAARLPGIALPGVLIHKIEDLAESAFQSEFRRAWQMGTGQGGFRGEVTLTLSDGCTRKVGYSAAGNVLPGRHVAVFHIHATPVSEPSILDDQFSGDCALFAVDSKDRIVAWYAGAERMYGHTAAEINGEAAARLIRDELDIKNRGRDLDRVAAAGYLGREQWHRRKDGSSFRANMLMTALRDETGELRGFATLVRNFSEAVHAHAFSPPITAARESTIAGVVSGEFDRITEASDAFLRIVRYSREDLDAGQLRWSSLVSSEHLSADQCAHEEALQYGASTPVEEGLIRKDGGRTRALVVRTTLNLTPLRWTAFVQDLTERRPTGTDDGQQVIADGFEGIVGTSAALKRVLAQVAIVAPTDATVLILGETGTGKELVARAIHRISARRARPFVTLNCAAIPTGLLESELFGYEKGAFTGALSKKIGRFEMAHGGTLFLDEVGDIPLELQPKLLRALQEKEFERLGGTRTIPIDVRLLAATNRNLKQMMGDKLFRSDLYYRLKVFPISVPPLRDHPEDIPVLAYHFTRKYALQMHKKIETIPPDNMRALTSWPWPGNVRELENFIERAVILSQGTALRAPLGEIEPDPADLPSSATLADVERDYIIRVLRETQGVITKAASRLGVPRTTLNAMMRKLSISRRDL